MKTEAYTPQCIYHLSNLKAAKIFSYHPFFKILKGIHKPILENTYKIIDKLI